MEGPDVGAAEQGVGHAVLGKQCEQLPRREVAAVVGAQQRPGVQRLERRHAGGSVGGDHERGIGRPGAVHAVSEDPARLPHRVAASDDDHARLRRRWSRRTEHTSAEIGRRGEQIEGDLTVGARSRPGDHTTGRRWEHAEDPEPVAVARRRFHQRARELRHGEAVADGGVARRQLRPAGAVDTAREERVRRTIETQRQRLAVRRPHRRPVGAAGRTVRGGGQRQAGAARAVEVIFRRRQHDPEPEVGPRQRRRRRGRLRHRRRGDRGRRGGHDRRIVGLRDHDDADDRRSGCGEHGRADDPRATAAGVLAVEDDVAERGERGRGGLSRRRGVTQAGVPARAAGSRGRL